MHGQSEDSMLGKRKFDQLDAEEEGEHVAKRSKASEVSGDVASGVLAAVHSILHACTTFDAATVLDKSERAEARGRLGRALKHFVASVRPVLNCDTQRRLGAMLDELSADVAALEQPLRHRFVGESTDDAAAPMDTSAL